MKGLALAALGLAAGLGGAPTLAAVVCVDCDAPGPEHNGATWDTAFLTIQEGVAAATPGGAVWVADGTYVENVVMGEGVQVYGGFLGAEEGGYETSLDQRDYVRNLTVIDGDQSGSCLIMAVCSRVDGFVITNGNGVRTEGYARGGGIYCSGIGEAAVIANNLICENWADLGGGIYGYESSPTVMNNLVVRNSVAYFGGGLLSELGRPTVCGNTFCDNWARLDGGGVYYAYWLGLLTDNTINLNHASRDGGGVHFILPIWGGGAGAPLPGNQTRVAVPLDVQGVIECNLVADNTAGEDGGGVYLDQALSVYLESNVITGNESMFTGGGIACFWYYCTPVMTGNSIACNSSLYGGGMFCYGAAPTLTNNDVTGNSAGWGAGICLDADARATLSNNAVLKNTADYQGGGILCFAEAAAALSHDDVWGNVPNDYSGCEPGEGDISADPLFVNPDAGDFHLTLGSPCIGAGANDAPELPETDWDGEARIINGTVDIGADEYVAYYTEAPDPQPEGEGPLFGGSQSGFPAWVWFSIPLTPDCVVGSGCGDPNALLGFECGGRLWCFEKYLKSSQVYKPPFIKWDLAVGDSYLLYLEADVPNPGYEGITPFIPWTFEFKLGRQGWTWVGMPGPTELTGDAFMDSVRVKYPSDDTGVCRTARQDRAASPDNWASWGWPYWNTWLQTPETFTPYAPFGHRTCCPWVGYRAWVNVGTAQSPDDPDQVTLIWP